MVYLKSLQQPLLNELSKYELTNDFITFYNNVNIIFENNREYNDEIKNILVSQFDGLGDAILSTCFIRELHNIYPSANIYLAMPKQYINIYKNCTYVKFLPCNPSNNNMFSILKDLIIFCTNNLPNIDICFSPMWDPKISALFLNWLSGAPIRVGYGKNTKALYFKNLDYYLETWGKDFNFDSYLLTNLIINPPTMYSEIERKLYILESFCKTKIKDKSLTLFNDKVDINKYLTNKKKIAVGLSGSSPNKKYPLDKWIEVLSAFNKDYTIYLLDSEYIDINIGINLTGKLTLNETIELIKNCDLYVGHDTSLAHIASAANIPCVILYKEAIEKDKFMPGFLSYYHRYKPLTKCICLRPVKAKGECKKMFIEGHCYSKESHCIKSIPVNKVIKSIKNLLK